MSTEPTEGRPIRVCVLAGHPMVRAGIRNALREDRDLDLAGEACLGEAALRLVAASRPDVVIVDLDPDLRDGIALVPQMSRLLPSVKAIVVAGRRGADAQRAILDSGARGLVSNDAPAAVLLKAVHQVHEGHLWFARDLLASAVLLQAPRVRGPTGAATSLTAREREMVALICEGLRNGQVALRLGMAEKTVRNRLSAVFGKLGVSDRLGLVVHAFRNGLAGPSEAHPEAPTATPTAVGTDVPDETGQLPRVRSLQT